MSQFTIFFGGSVGSDPNSPGTWSGIGPFLLKAMRSAGILFKAEGIRVQPVINALLLAKNFNSNRTVWRSQYYLDSDYRCALTRAARHISVSTPLVLQIGHMFSLPDAFPHKKCISYHDGNLAERLKSGFSLEGISRRRIDQALRYEEKTAGQMTAVFTFSEYLRQSFICDYHVPAARVFNVGAGINLTEIPPFDPQKNYTVPRILFIGIEFDRKGGSQLLEAFRIVRNTLPEAELHVVGPPKIQSPPPGVVFHGRLSKSEPTQKRQLHQLFRDASIFALPSLYEPFGIAPLEAMLYQLPCVLTDAWAFRETVIPGFNGELVPKGCVDGIAMKLVQLLSNPERLATMGQNGRELVLRKFTWSAVANRMTAAIPHLSG